MVGFGTVLSGMGGAAPQLEAMQQQQQKQQQQAAIAKAMQQYAAQQKQQQGPGGMQAAPNQGAMPTQSPSVAGLPGSAPAPQGFMGSQPDLSTMMTSLSQSGLSLDQQFEALQQYGAFASPFEKMQNQLTMAQQKMDMQQQMLTDRLGMMETIARMNNSTRERGQDIRAKSKPTVGKNDVIKAYQDWQKNPDDKSLEKNWSDLREAYNSTKIPAGGGKSNFSDKAIDEYADQLEKTGKLPTGLGIGQNADKVAVVNRHAEKYPDSKLDESALDYTGKTSEKKAEGTRAGAIEISSGAVEGAAKMAIEASNKVDRTQFPTLNSVELAVKKGTGDTAVIDLNAKTNTLINEYAAAQNPRGVPRIEDKKYARDLLEAAYSKGQYLTGVKAIIAETKNIKKKTGQVMRGEDTSEVLPGDSENAPDYSHLWGGGE